MPALDSFREFVQFFGVAAAQHDVIGDQRFLQLHKRVLNVALPIFFAEAGQAWFSEIIFNDTAVAIRQIAQFEREDVMAPNKGRSKSGAQPEKKHPATVITAKRLHRRIVDNTD